MRKLYQLCDRDESEPNAGGKAAKDMAYVASALGFERVEISTGSREKSFLGFVKRHLGFFRDYIKAYRRIEKDSVLLLQHPLYVPVPTRCPVFWALKKIKKVKFISHVIDVEELRGLMNNGFIKHEFSTMLKWADVIIAHNERMLNWFLSKGVERQRLEDVEIFDNIWSGEVKRPEFERSVTVAGNLSLKKSGYLKYLGGVGDYPVHLYGPLENEEETLAYFTAAKYHGVFPSEELPHVLTGGFGLVWDGDSAEGGTGSFGEYLKYNDPHKFSLFLSAGMPVIVWEESAAALFVRKHNVGICIKNLDEIPDILNNITEEQWKIYSDNAFDIGEKIRTGYHFRTAVETAMGKIAERGQNGA